MRITVTLDGAQAALFEELMKLPLLAINKPALVARHFLSLGMMKVQGEASRDPSGFNFGGSAAEAKPAKTIRKKGRKK